MREILSDVSQWFASGEQNIAVAMVVSTWGSAPRGISSKFALAAGDRVSGSVSGGCVEGAVYDAELVVLQNGKPQLLKFGVADETAFEQVGLACGGSIEVFVQRLAHDDLQFWQHAAQTETGFATATVIEGTAESIGRKITFIEGQHAAQSTPAHALDAALYQQARTAYENGASAQVTLDVAGQVYRAFVDVQLPSPRLILIGGVHIAIALCDIAHTLGYRVVIVDPRDAFGNAQRFPRADQILNQYPEDALPKLHLNRATAVVTLTHDSKFDDPALQIALPSAAFYVGALGGRTTREKRRVRLSQAGMRARDLERLRSPIGLPIHTTTPEEIALATMAEIVAAKNEMLQSRGA